MGAAVAPRASSPPRPASQPAWELLLRLQPALVPPVSSLPAEQKTRERGEATQSYIKGGRRRRGRREKQTSPIGFLSSSSFLFLEDGVEIDGGKCRVLERCTFGGVCFTWGNNRSEHTVNRKRVVGFGGVGGGGVELDHIS